MKYDLLKLEAVENENFNALYFDILLNYGRSKAIFLKLKKEMLYAMLCIR